MFVVKNSNAIGRAIRIGLRQAWRQEKLKPFIAAALHRTARASCTRRTSLASLRRVSLSPSRAVHAPLRRESSPGQDRALMRMSCRLQPARLGAS